jgi:L-asparaginase
VAAGALPAGLLRPSQARILLIAMLGTGAGLDEVRSVFADASAEPTLAAGRRPPATH